MRFPRGVLPWLFALLFTVVTACDAPVTNFIGVSSAPTSGLKATFSPAVSLESLTVSAGTLSPSFSPDITDYTVQVANAITSMTVGASPYLSSSTVSSPGTVALSVGRNDLVLTVSDEEREGTGTYTLHVIRDLARSSVSAGLSLNYTLNASANALTALSPPFSPMTTNYAFSVPNAATSVNLAPTLADPLASAVQTGGASLVPGVNAVTLEITASDGVTKSLYTFAVTRLPYGTLATVLPSNDSSLTALATTASGAALSPAFSPNITTYLLQVPNTTVTVPFNLTGATGSSMNTVSPASGVTTATRSTAPQYTYTFAATNGTSTPVFVPLKIAVVAQDGSSTTYTVNVEQLGNTGRVLSGDSSLTALTVTAGGVSQTLVPVFSPAKTLYRVNLPAGTTSVSVARTAVTGATAGTTTGTTGLSVGTNTLTVPVTAPDGSTTTYTILASIQPPASADASLKSLAVSGATLSPAFSADVTTYSATLASGTTSAAVTAVSNDALASVTISGNTGLVTGSNTLSVLVRATDGTTSRVYTINASVGSGGGSGGGTGGGSALPTGAAFSGTATYGGASSAALYIWVTNAAGIYVDSLSRYRSSQSQIITPNAWTTAAGSGTTVDGVSSATWVGTKTFTWDLKDHTGVLVAPGTYTVHILGFTKAGSPNNVETKATVALGITAALRTTANFSPLNASLVSAGSVTYTTP